MRVRSRFQPRQLGVYRGSLRPTVDVIRLIRRRKVCTLDRLKKDTESVQQKLGSVFYRPQERTQCTSEFQEFWLLSKHCYRRIKRNLSFRGVATDSSRNIDNSPTYGHMNIDTAIVNMSTSAVFYCVINEIELMGSGMVANKHTVRFMVSSMTIIYILTLNNMVLFVFFF